ncbi:MAG: TonB-dependent receptor plug domain-containing protein [Prevotella sp.]|nr:TonB-dependent receptor plug domain-containing protein [Prevotella sp.]MBQ9650116.1 TonB-dependent receptor plug domain-containing protein [Prevotella sp.]
MFLLNILLSAFLVLPLAEGDTIRTEHLDEVVVTSNSARQRIQNVQTGAEVIQLEDLTSAPQLFGQADIMRSIQLLPGVKAESDASSSFQVRGGTSAQNQVLFDLAPVYNSGHLAGLFSAFNDDALVSATLYKGLLPAQYGGASSAVLDITGKTGNRNEWHGGANVGLLSAKGTLEGPIVKDKASLLVTARRSYMDLFLKASKDFRDNTLYFYDVNAKLDWSLNRRNQLYLTFFTSHDRTSVEKMADIRWSNMTANLKWLHHFNGDSYAQTTAYLSNYQTENGVDFLRMNLWYKGHIRQLSLRQDFALQFLPASLQLRAGLQTSLFNVKSAEWQVLTKYDKEQRRAWENTGWINGTFNLRPDLQASVGLRINAFSPLGGSLYYDVEDNGDIGWYYNYGTNEIVKTHLTLEPRASISWQPTSQTSIKLGYARTSQNLHALRNQSTSTPFDRYTMSSNIVEPELADQWSAGVYMMTPQQDYDFSVEGYYRKIRNVLDYKDGKSFSSEIEIERLVLAGDGKSYGVEFCARKNSGRLTGWIGYTLSWSKTRIDGINGGQWYDANNDRRHDINIVGIFRLNRRWTFNASWVFNSGQAFTAPSGKYQIIDNWIYYYAERNGYRAPDYHHLDVSAVWKSGKKKGGKRKVETEWVFGIYNIYNRYNPFLINFEDSADGARTKAKQYSLFGIVPSVAFNIQW